MRIISRFGNWDFRGIETTHSNTRVMHEFF